MTVGWVRRAAPLLAVSGVLVLLGLTVRLAGLALLEPADRPPLALRLLDVNRERNLPTAWSVGLLLGCCWAAARLGARLPGRSRAGWLLVAAVPALMAVDEALQVHERADALGRTVVGDALHFAWVVPGALVALGVSALAVRVLRQAPPGLRRRLAASAGLYLAGALVVEACSGAVLDAVGRGVLYAVLNAAEEGLEMAGASLALVALLLAAEALPVRRPSPGGLPTQRRPRRDASSPGPASLPR